MIAVALLILFGPVLMLALFSFNDSSIISLPWEGFTTRGTRRPGTRPRPSDAILNSLLVASLVTIGSLVLGTLAAWGLTRLRFPGRGLLAGLHGSVLVVPWLIIGVAGLIFFSQSGIALSLTTVGLMQLVVTFPLVVAIISAGLVRFPRSVEEAAIDLGASQGQMLRHVVLPQIAPSLAAAAIFAFAWSFNNFEVSFFTGGFEQTFPVWVFSILRQSENLPMVNAVSTVIALAQVIAVFAGWRLMKRLTRDRGGDKRAHRPDDRDGALMEAATVPAAGGTGAGRAGKLLRPLAFMPARPAVLALFFLGADGGDAGDQPPVRGPQRPVRLHAHQLHRRAQRPALPRGRLDDVPDRDDRDGDPARDRDPDRLRARLQGRASGSCRCCSSSCSPTSSTRWSASTPGGCCSAARG